MKLKKIKKNKKKLILIILITIPILLALFSFFLINKKTNLNKNKLVQEEKTLELTLKEASDKIIQDNLKLKDKAVYTYIIKGDWDYIKNEIEKTKSHKELSFILKNINKEFINNNKNLISKISISDYFKYLWNNKDTNFTNAYINALKELISFDKNKFLNFQEEINKAYFNTQINTNNKLLYLDLALSYENKNSIKVFKDAVSLNHSTLTIAAIRNVKNIKDQAVTELLVKLTENDNISIKALSFKILGYQKNNYAKQNIKNLLESNNAYLVETAIYIIKELELINEYIKIIEAQIPNMDSFNREKALNLINN